MWINATKYIRRMRGGSQAHLIECSDGHSYVVKFQNNPQHRRILVNELIGAALLKQLQIEAPDTAFVRTDAEFLRTNPDVCLTTNSLRTAPVSGWHFGSRFPGDVHTTAIYDFVPDALLSQVANPGAFLGVLVFDKWTANSDGRQAIFCRTRLRGWNPNANPLRMGFLALMVDHGFIMNGPHWNFPESAAQGLYSRTRVYHGVRSMHDFEPWIERVLRFPEIVITTAFRAVPPEWMENDEAKLEAALEKLWKRRSRIEQLVDDVCLSRVSPFTNWNHRLSA